METPEDTPTGLPEDAPEGQPLGPEDPDPEGEGEQDRGPESMPGIPTEGEPPTAG